MSKKPRQKALLRLERLESRAMLAGDTVCDHNALLPEDANGSGDVTAIDALVVINEIARSARAQAAGAQATGSQVAGSQVAGSQSSATTSRAIMADVNADGKATAIDALVIVNKIGQARRGGSVASRVPIENRIHRLAADIESGTLPRNLDLATATAILAKLKAGKLPEVNDTPAAIAVNDTTTGDSSSTVVDDTKLVDDTVTDNTGTDGGSTDNTGTDDTGSDDTGTDDTGTDDSDNSPDNSGDDSSGNDGTDDDPTTDNPVTDNPVTDDPATDENPDDSTDGENDCLDPAAHLTQLADRIAQRLTAAGVSTEVLASVAAAFAAAIDAAEPLSRADILKLLSDSGVDATILAKLANDGRGGDHHDHDLTTAIDRLSEKLLENGNDAAIVETLITELKAAVDAGTPLSREEVTAKIEALGLTLPLPTEHGDHGGRGDHGGHDGFDQLKERLLSSGNDPVVVDDLIAELTAALEAGTPLSREEVKAKIEDLGLTLPKPLEMPRLAQMIGRIHAVRDAYFASMARGR